MTGELGDSIYGLESKREGAEGQAHRRGGRWPEGGAALRREDAVARGEMGQRAGEVAVVVGVLPA